ncbi:hypothetical protein [Streptomyces smyrnaeus]|uniref:hypothetical protein n=1 Tax=Streptomyces smyrnaeus TaxID=1387713 RepID=UPI0033D5B961
MTGRDHITESTGEPAPRRREQLTGWKSPAVTRWEEQQARKAAEAEVDRFRTPETRGDLDRMTFADRCRVYLEDQPRYQRLMGST